MATRCSVGHHFVCINLQRGVKLKEMTEESSWDKTAYEEKLFAGTIWVLFPFRRWALAWGWIRAFQISGSDSWQTSWKLSGSEVQLQSMLRDWERWWRPEQHQDVLPLETKSTKWNWIMTSINARDRHRVDFVSKKVVNAKSLSLLTVRCKLFALETQDGLLVPANLSTSIPGTSLAGHGKAQWGNVNPVPRQMMEAGLSPVLFITLVSHDLCLKTK